MPVYPSIYRAKAVQITSSKVVALVPQVFGTTPIDVTNFLGTPQVGLGWIFFQAGQAEHPVWMGVAMGGNGDGGGGGPSLAEVWVDPDTPPDVILAAGETLLWVDTDEVDEEPLAPALAAHTYIWESPALRAGTVGAGRVTVLVTRMRTGEAVTVLISKTDADGSDAQLMLLATQPGDLLILASSVTTMTWNRYQIASAPIDMGDHFEVPGTLVNSSGSFPQVDEPLRVGVFLTVGAGGGAVGAGSYVHDQMTPSATWVIVHNLGFYPNVRIEDSAGSDVEGDVTQDSVNQMTVTFASAFSGKAYLS